MQLRHSLPFSLLCLAALAGCDPAQPGALTITDGADLDAALAEAEDDAPVRPSLEEALRRIEQRPDPDASPLQPELDLSQSIDPSEDFCWVWPELKVEHYACGSCFDGHVGTGKVRIVHTRYCNSCTYQPGTGLCTPWEWVSNCVPC